MRPHKELNLHKRGGSLTLKITWMVSKACHGLKWDCRVRILLRREVAQSQILWVEGHCQNWCMIAFCSIGWHKQQLLLNSALILCLHVFIVAPCCHIDKIRNNSFLALVFTHNDFQSKWKFAKRIPDHLVTVRFLWETCWCKSSFSSFAEYSMRETPPLQLYCLGLKFR